MDWDNKSPHNASTTCLHTWWSTKLSIEEKVHHFLPLKSSPKAKILKKAPNKLNKATTNEKIEYQTRKWGIDIYNEKDQRRGETIEVDKRSRQSASVSLWIVERSKRSLGVSSQGKEGLSLLKCNL